MFGIADYGSFVAAIVLFLAIPGPGNLALITSTSKGGVRGGLAIERRRDAERAGGGAVKVAPHHAVVVVHAGLDIKRAEHGVIKLFGRFKVVGAKHHVTEHSCLLWLCAGMVREAHKGRSLQSIRAL